MSLFLILLSWMGCDSSKKPEANHPGVDRSKLVRASDGTFSMRVPGDWTVRRAELQRLMLWSPEGERKFWYSSGPIGDQQFVDNLLRGEALRRRNSGQKPLTPEEVQRFKRKASVRLSPVDVVKVYWPRVNAPLVENMRILDVPELPPEVKRLQESSRLKGAIVRYKYTLRPKQGSLMHDDELPPGFIGHDKVNMAGVAGVLCPDWSIHTWYYVAQGVEAPVEVFQKNRALYADIDGSVQWDLESVRKVIAAATGPYKKAATDAVRLRDEMGKAFSRAMMGSISCPRCRHHNVWTASQCENCGAAVP
jgi:hypothetical protein